MTPEPELLPCPFCGEKAERIRGGVIRCRCSIMQTHDGTFPCPAHGSQVKFAWMWNRRTPEPALAAFVEAAKHEYSVKHEADMYGVPWKDDERIAAAEEVTLAAYRKWQGGGGG